MLFGRPGTYSSLGNPPCGADAGVTLFDGRAFAAIVGGQGSNADGFYSPYGTDIALNGLRAAPPPIKFGMRLDILGVVLGSIVATGLIIGAIADR